MKEEEVVRKYARQLLLGAFPMYSFSRNNAPFIMLFGVVFSFFAISDDMPY